MRAGMVLQALTKSFEVHVLVVPLGSRTAYRTLHEQLADSRSRFLVVDDSARVLAPQFRASGRSQLTPATWSRAGIDRRQPSARQRPGTRSSRLLRVIVTAAYSKRCGAHE